MAPGVINCPDRCPQRNRAERRPLGGTVVRGARGREKLYLVHVAAQEVARRERRGSGTKQGAASDPTTRTPDCTKATSSSALASLRDFSNAARRRRRRSDAPVEVIDLPYKLRLGVDEASAGAAHQRERLFPWSCGPGPRAVAGRRCPFESSPWQTEMLVAASARSAA